MREAAGRARAERQPDLQPGQVAREPVDRRGNGPPPVAVDGRLLIDGVVRTPVPTGVVADLGGDVTIGVRLAPVPEGAGATGAPAALTQPNLVDIVFTVLDVMQEAIESLGSERADLMIHPQVSKVTLRRFAEGRALVEAGEAAAEEALPGLRRLLPWLEGSDERRATSDE